MMEIQKDKRRFQPHDFNIFVAVLTVLMFVLLMPLSAMIRYMFQSVFVFVLSDNILVLLVLFSMIAGLYWSWDALDLSPLPIKGRQEEWRRGHVYVAVGNALILVPIIVVALVVLISGNQNNVTFPRKIVFQG
jgi:hypothetical protein